MNEALKGLLGIKTRNLVNLRRKSLQLPKIVSMFVSEIKDDGLPRSF